MLHVQMVLVRIEVNCVPRYFKADISVINFCQIRQHCSFFVNPSRCSTEDGAKSQKEEGERRKQEQEVQSSQEAIRKQRIRYM